MSRSQQPLEFFVDRSLGRRRVPQALRDAGWTLRTHHEIYGERDEQAARFDRSRQRIEEACADPGPFVYAVHADRIVRVFPA